jgi:hypothetical protein
MSKYLYGATVNGIQGYIFRTDKLVEIAGASVLVKQVCEDLFAEMLNISAGKLRDERGLLLSAAGNIKFLFTEEQTDVVQRVVREFPMKVSKLAPGITLSQAVVEISTELKEEHLRKLEENLKIQRNKTVLTPDFALQIQLRSRQTGNPAITIDEDGRYLDKEVVAKIEAANSPEKNIWSDFYDKKVSKRNQPFDLEKICRTKSNDYSWIAVIHADGNGLGNLLMSTSKALGNDFADFLPKLSKLLDEATKKAATEAYRKVHVFDDKVEPARPVIIGGDDLTIIIRADLAVAFTKEYLSEFERLTKERLKPLCDEFPNKGLEAHLANGLTACAGIAIMKYNYPFHYGVSLAEALCAQAKKLQTESPKQSSLLFHKILSSFVDDFKELKERELIVRNLKDETYSLMYGPYYLHPNEGKKRSLDSLLDNMHEVQGKNALKSGLRQWLSALGESRRQADILQKRIESKHNLDKLLPFLSSDKPEVTPVADWLTLISINN